MAKSDRNGQRKCRDSRKRRKPDLGYYFVVTDTKATEKNYLMGLHRSLPKDTRKRIVIKVSNSKTSELVNKCKSMLALEPQYAQPWIVFDRDRVAEFDKIIQDAEREGIEVGWSNPCIEIWFDAYFGHIHAYMDSKQCCNRFAETFERITGREYSKSDEHLYELLNRYGDEEKALELAEKRLKTYEAIGVTKPSKKCPGTCIHRLVKEIKEKHVKENTT